MHRLIDADQRSALGSAGQPTLRDLLRDRLQQRLRLPAHQTQARAPRPLPTPLHARPTPLPRRSLGREPPPTPNPDQVTPPPTRPRLEPLIMTHTVESGDGRSRAVRISLRPRLH